MQSDKTPQSLLRKLPGVDHILELAKKVDLETTPLIIVDQISYTSKKNLWKQKKNGRLRCKRPHLIIVL